MPEGFLRDLKKRIPSTVVEQSSDFASSLADAAIVYTDVWTSMGQEAEANHRRVVFQPFQVNEAR